LIVTRLIQAITVFLLLILSSCSAGESTPTPYPDTPSPAEVNAPLVESPALVSIQFINELDGWAVTETQIVRTNDGGITWYNVTPPEVTETGYSVDTFVLDNDHVWMQLADLENFPNSGSLYHTTDGGLTWTSNKVPFSRGDLNFLDSNNGWVISKLGIAAGSMGVSVFQTSDGGATWDQTYTNDPNLTDAGESLPLGGLKSGLAALDMQTAWVYGLIYAPGTVYLYRTEDGGANWNEQSLPLPQGAENAELAELSVEKIAFIAPNFGFLTMRLTSENINLAVYVSNDSGNTWSLTPTLIPGAGSTDFLSTNEAVIYNGSQFYVTRDAARTWSIIPPDVLFGESFAGMDFVNVSSGWVITVDPTTNHRALYRTSDGGATWFPVIP
jgi:photosystem II stability/assembly factor-like uncharacterized protein